MRSERIARAIVRLYPRAWRARYESEMLALLEAVPAPARVLADIARGCAREHLARLFGRPSPVLRARLRVLSRVPEGIALAVVIAWSAWEFTNLLDAREWLAPQQSLSHWGFGLALLLIVRSLLASQAVNFGETRFALWPHELSCWLVVAFASVVFERCDQFYLQRLPWNENRNLGYAWTDIAMRLSTPLMFLLSGTRSAAVDIQTIRTSKKKPNVPEYVLGLNR